MASRKRPKGKDMGEQTRRCKICGEKKPIAFFAPGAWNPKNKAADVWVRACLHCKELNKWVALPKNINIEKLRARGKSLERDYGISLKEYEEIYIRQNGVCAICYHPEPIKGRIFLAVDHDHKTGRVRGLLCSKCNMAIGIFEDRIDRLQNAIRYIKRSKPLD